MVNTTALAVHQAYAYLSVERLRHSRMVLVSPVPKNVLKGALDPQTAASE